jgi:hypothetical protein
MHKFARQGDLVITKLEPNDPILKNLVFAEETDPIVGGYDGSAHKVLGTVLIARSEREIVIKCPIETRLVHIDRHLPIPLDAKTYRIKSLRERGDKNDRAVED